MSRRFLTDRSLNWLLIFLSLAVGGFHAAYSVAVVNALLTETGEAARPIYMDLDTNRILAVNGLEEANGVKRGDDLMELGGKPYTGEAELSSMLRGKRPGDPLTLRVRRDGVDRTVTLLLAPYQGPSNRVVRWFFYLVTQVVTPLFCIALGLVVVFIRVRDPLAWLLLGLMLSFANLSANGDFVANILWRWLNPFRDAGLAYHTMFGAAWAIPMLLFGIYFPERLAMDRRRPWLKWLIIAPLAANGMLMALLSIADAEISGRFSALAAATGVLEPASVYLGMVAVGGFFAALGYRIAKAPAPDARRRLRLLRWGASAAMLPLLFVVIFGLARGFGSIPELVWVPAFFLLILFPMTLAYVIVVHRAMDLRAVLRQGLQYALAQRGVRVAQVLATAGVVAAGFLLAEDPSRNRAEKIAVLAVGFALAGWLNAGATKLRLWVDQRFFREAYRAEQVLGELSQEVRTMIETQPLLETVARRISETLHVERIAMLVNRGGRFEAAYATGYTEAPSVSFEQGAGAAGVLERNREPLRVYFDDPDSWVYRNAEMNGAETGRLRALDTQLLLPLAVREKMVGMVSLGPKRSEEPYSNSDVSMLESVAAQTGLALENSRLTGQIAGEVARRERLNRELEIAREVQERLFPQSFPEVKGLEYGGRCRPALGVGGDYYDFLHLPDGRFGIAIGDISGKGIPAALLMASLQASLRGQTIDGRTDLAKLMANLNRLIYDTSPENRYATFFYAQYDTATRDLLYVNGGHNPPMIFRGDEVIRLEAGGPVIGLFPPSRYVETHFQMQPGDIIVLFTDGISEAMDPAEEEWGEEALIEAVRGCRTLSCMDMIGRMIEEADRFAAGAPQHDDMTAMVVKVR